MEQPDSDGSLHVSNITFKAQRQFDKTVDHIVIQTETEIWRKQFQVEISSGQEYRDVLDPALRLSVQDRLSMSLQHRSPKSQRGSFSITIVMKEAMDQAWDDGQRKKTYVKIDNDIEVTLSFLCYSMAGAWDPPIINKEIVSKCDRYRVLIIGNSGVGKSTLIKTIFGIQDVDVSDSRRGEADINRGLPAIANGPFILHDSLGFEAGESENYDVVKNFILDRRERKDLKERLHAVWICLAVPYAKGRFTEAGTERLLQKRHEIMGDIPVIVALTQVDLLERSVLLALQREGNVLKTVHEAKPLVGPRRSKFLDQYCTQPLRKAAGDVIHIPVSTDKGFALEYTIPELVQTTVNEIEIKAGRS